MRPLVIRKLKSFGSLEITGRRVDGLRRALRYHFSLLFPLFQEIYYVLLHIFVSLRPGIASIYRYIIGISAMDRYIGDHLRTSS